MRYSVADMYTRTSKLLAVALFVLLNSMILAIEPPDPVIKDQQLFDPKRPLSRELEMSVADGFKLAAVGDCIISRPLSSFMQSDETFSKAIQILQESDATVGNLETTILELGNFKGYPYSWDGDWTLLSEPQVAKDLAIMGFDLFSRSNNHVMDWGIEGMRETSQWLDQANLIHAGAGENEAQARAAHYFDSKKGRIGIVSMASSFRPTTDALPPQGTSPGRPGINALNVKRITVVTPEMMSSLTKIYQQIYPDKNGKATDKLNLFDNEIEVGKSFGYRHEMDQQDLAAILKSIRSGKQHSDFLIATIHSHETLNASTPEQPADFLKDLARASIDAGADVFIVTGIHHLGPIELYKGKPIFYGLGNFFWSDIQEALPHDLYQGNADLIGKAFKHPDQITDADLTNVMNARAFANDLTFQTMIAQSTFANGSASEIVLYPIDLGYGEKLTKSGIPRLADSKKASEILNRLKTISSPYGTNIEIQNNTGVIKLSKTH
jgi:poly-gamma-glutamate capsule biosynthesis protein CapA/YwtB (metallophosphatase superfamily)